MPVSASWDQARARYVADLALSDADSEAAALPAWFAHAVGETSVMAPIVPAAPTMLVGMSTAGPAPVGAPADD